MSEIQLFGVIGEDVTAPEVKAALADADRTQTLVVKIDSPGGSVFAGNAIHAALRAYDGPKKAVVESFAGSIASFILTAFDEVEITSNGYVMIHNPSMDMNGDDEDHARSAKLLAEIKEQMITAYADRMGASPEEVARQMKSETFFSAQEAQASGLVGSVLDTSKPSALQDVVFNSMPHRVVACVRSVGEPLAPKEKPMADKNEPVAASVKEIKAMFPKMASDFILTCVEKELPMASVAAAAAEELMAENETLKAENADLQAKLSAMEEDGAEAKAKAVEEEESKANAEATAKANAPVARATTTPGETAKQRWDSAVSACVSEGLPRAKAVQKANRTNPGLRAEMLAEVNA